MSAQAEPDLDGAPADFRLVFDKAPDAILLVDDQRRFVAGNRSARELLGVGSDRLLEMRIDDIVPVASRSGLDDQWRRFREAGHQTGQFLVQAQDGREHVVEFRALANYEPGRHLSILRPIATPPLRTDGEAVLSKREREVLGLLAGGSNGSEVAENLFISRATVATHVRNAMRKLGAKTRVEAIVIALRDREIEL